MVSPAKIITEIYQGKTTTVIKTRMKSIVRKYHVCIKISYHTSEKPGLLVPASTTCHRLRLITERMFIVAIAMNTALKITFRNHSLNKNGIIIAVASSRPATAELTAGDFPETNKSGTTIAIIAPRNRA